MKRRELLRTMAGLATAGAAFRATLSTAKGSPVQIMRYGLVTVHSHTAHLQVTGDFLHVFVNGEDVSRSCCEANDVDGYAVVYCRDEKQHASWSAQGHIHVDSNHRGACKIRLTGDVIIAPGPKP